LIEAYQEHLMSPDELRTRMPSLRHRGTTVPIPQAPRPSTRTPACGQRGPGRARLNQSSAGTQFRSPATIRPRVCQLRTGHREHAHRCNVNTPGSLMMTARIGEVNT
jgi:hypothetical protein